MAERADQRFVASLPAEDRAALTRRSTLRGLLHLAGHLSVIAVLGAWVASGAFLWWLAIWPLGIALVFMFTLQHECTHDTPFAVSWLNTIVGHACGLVLIQPFHWFRAFHLAHHRHTHDPARDPELEGGPKPENWGELLVHLSSVGYWAMKVRVLWANAFARLDAPYFGPRQGPRLRREARVMLAIYALGLLALISGQTWLFWLWLLPLALGFPVLRLFLLAEHGGCPHVPDMFANSRTTLTTRAVRYLAWNMPYHAEHHAMPQVPFHALPDLHRKAEEQIATLTPGYTRFARDYVAGMDTDMP